VDGLERRLQDEKKPEVREDRSEDVKIEDNFANGRETQRQSLDTSALETTFFPDKEARFASVRN